jgi:uncharacterized protein DUF222/HNH endonuclease
MCELAGAAALLSLEPIPDSVPDEEVAGELCRLLRQRDLLSLRASRLAGTLWQRGYGESQGSVSTLDWIRHQGQLNFASAAELVWVGQEMDSLAESVAAMQGGEIGFQHLALMARTQRGLRESARWRQAMEQSGDQAGRDPAGGPGSGEPAGQPGQGPTEPAPRPLPEAHLLAEAREVSVSRFRHLCQEARHAADPAGVAGEQARALEERSLRLQRQQDGMLSVSGILDPIGGASLQAALEPLARPSGRHDRRGRERRLADALVELAQHAMDQASPRQRPHLNLTATLGTLYQTPGSAAAQLEHGDPVSGVTVSRIVASPLPGAPSSTIRRQLFRGAPLQVELGRRKRVVSAPLRQALEARDRHCRWPGCTRPGSWCEAHHLLHWAAGGRTDPANLLLLCYRHHVQVHEGRWQLLVDAAGRVEVVRPPLDLAAPPRGPSPWRAA